MSKIIQDWKTAETPKKTKVFAYQDAATMETQVIIIQQLGKQVPKQRFKPTEIIHGHQKLQKRQKKITMEK